MPISIDPYQVLNSIASSAKVFEHIDSDIEKAAKSLIEKSIKSTKLNFEKLGDIQRALGQDLFALVLEELPQRALQTICKRIDRHHENFSKGAPTPDEIWLRAHLLNLACGEAQPAEKSVKSKSKSTGDQTKKVSSSKKRTPAKIGSRTAVSAKRRRK